MVEPAVAQLRDAARSFQEIYEKLLAGREAARVDKRLASNLNALLAEGAGIRGGITTATRLLDGARKWVLRTFQTDALTRFPFAEEVIERTAQGSISAIQHFEERARSILPALAAAQAKYAALDDEAKKGLGEVAPTPAPNPKAGLWLVVALGALIWLFNAQVDE